MLSQQKLYKLAALEKIAFYSCVVEDPKNLIMNLSMKL